MTYIGSAYVLGVLSASFFPAMADIRVYALLLAALIIESVLKAARKVFYFTYVFLVAFMVFKICQYNGEFRLRAMEGNDVGFSGYISSCDDSRSDMAVYTVRGRANGVPAILRIYADSKRCEIGDSISFDCELEPLEDGIFFSFSEYYFGKGIFMDAVSVENVEISRNHSPVNHIFYYRDYIISSVKRYLPHEEGELLVSMLCGDKSGLSDELESDMYAIGIGHIMAVSGMNTALLAAVVTVFSSRAGLKSGAKFCLVAAVVAFYAVFSGMSASVLRASLMILISLSARCFGRRADMPNSIALSAFVIALVSPYSVRDVSFLLSYTAIIGVTIIAPKFVSLLDKDKPFYRIKSAFAASFAVSLSVTPLSVAMFGEISILSPIVNVILLPLCSLALISGFFVLIYGGVVAAPFVIFSGLCCKLVIAASRFTADVSDMLIGYLKYDCNFVRICVIIMSLVLIGAAYLSGRFKKFIAAAVSVLVLAAGIVYGYLESGRLKVAFLGDESSLAVVISKGGEYAVIDIDGDGDCAYDVSRYLGRAGADVLVMLDRPLSTPTAYGERLGTVGAVYLNEPSLDGITMLGVRPTGFESILEDIGGATVAIDGDGFSVSYGDTYIEYTYEEAKAVERGRTFSFPR